MVVRNAKKPQAIVVNPMQGNSKVATLRVEFFLWFAWKCLQFFIERRKFWPCPDGKQQWLVGGWSTLSSAIFRLQNDMMAAALPPQVVLVLAVSGSSYPPSRNPLPLPGSSFRAASAACHNLSYCAAAMSVFALCTSISALRWGTEGFGIINLCAPTLYLTFGFPLSWPSSGLRYAQTHPQIDVGCPHLAAGCWLLDSPALGGRTHFNLNCQSRASKS